MMDITGMKNIACVSAQTIRDVVTIISVGISKFAIVFVPKAHCVIQDSFSTPLHVVAIVL